MDSSRSLLDAAMDTSSRRRTQGTNQEEDTAKPVQHYVIVDEATDFDEHEWLLRYMRSRTSGLTTSPIPSLGLSRVSSQRKFRKMFERMLDRLHMSNFLPPREFGSMREAFGGLSQQPSNPHTESGRSALITGEKTVSVSLTALPLRTSSYDPAHQQPDGHQARL